MLYHEIIYWNADFTESDFNKWATKRQDTG